MQKPRTPSFLLRIVLPLIFIIGWLVVSGVGGPYFGRISEVSSNDMTTFLPSSAESTGVNAKLAQYRDSATIPAIVVFESDTSLSHTQQSRIADIAATLKDTQLLRGDPSPPMLPDDSKAAFVILPIASDAEFKTTIPKLQTAVANEKPDMRYAFTGPAVFTQDLTKAFAGIDGVLLLVALTVVFVILLIVYRSPVLPIVTLLGSIFALSAAILVVWWLAKAGVVQLNGQVQGILFILVIGAATDYSLLYIARFREELTHTQDTWHATLSAWRASWEPIVAAGGTVALGLLCLLVSDLGSNKALGPIGSIGIICAVLSALTFLPGVLLLLGKRAFWPRIPRHSSAVPSDYQAAHPTWSRVGKLVSKHPRRLWVGCTALLLIACFGVLQLRADGVAQSDFVLGASDARAGQKVLDAHFPSGSGSPAYVLAPAGEQTDIVKLLDADSGVASVSVTTADARVPNMPVGEAAKNLGPKAAFFAHIQPKTVDDTILLQATLRDPADSLAARQTIERIRTTLEAQHPSAKVGGVSAIQLDTNTAAERDLRVLMPLILLVITIILMILLRAVVAPLVLLMTTLISFGATLGIAAILFNHVWHYPGADPSVVIYGFVFLVALGIDYNIFLMTRVREETIKQQVRSGTIKALVMTGGVISSAGIVLASTFAALYVIPILFLAQIAFIVACGVLLDTLIVRSLIVPSLTLEIGRRMWWPSRLSSNHSTQKHR